MGKRGVVVVVVVSHRFSHPRSLTGRVRRKDVIDVDQREHDESADGGADLRDGAAPDERPASLVAEYRGDRDFGVGEGGRDGQLSDDDEDAPEDRVFEKGVGAEGGEDDDVGRQERAGGGENADQASRPRRKPQGEETRKRVGDGRQRH